MSRPENVRLSKTVDFIQKTAKKWYYSGVREKFPYLIWYYLGYLKTGGAVGFELAETHLNRSFESQINNFVKAFKAYKT